ncbi:MAG TPA: glycosyltransferase [Actinomycetales bacterium]
MRVVISDATIEPGSKALAARLGPAARVLPALSRALVRAADGPRVTWCVLSTEEVDSFSRTWGVPQSRIAFTPFSHTLFAPEDRRPTGHGTFVFSGGNSLRDYPLLVEAADGLGCEVVLATGWRPAQRKHWLTAESVPHERFVELMRQCRVMVLPLAPSTRSAGQQTYLNAMALGKVVIVTDGPGVRDHIDDGVTGVIVERTVEGLRAALRDVLDPARAEHYERMGQRARAKALVDYSPDTYRRSLLRLAGVTD